jgi:hypothetical protein
MRRCLSNQESLIGNDLQAKSDPKADRSGLAQALPLPRTGHISSFLKKPGNKIQTPVS